MDYLISGNMPLQLTDQSIRLAMNKTTGVFTNTMITLAFTNMGLAMLQSLSIQYFWSFISSQQLLAYIMLFNL